MARPRHADRRNLPANLYERRGYYWYRNPGDGKTFGLGRDRAAAVAQAIEANVQATRGAGKATLLERMTGREQHAFTDVLTRFRQDLKRKDLSPNTWRTKLCALRAVETRWPKSLVNEITTADIDDFLQGYVDADKVRMAHVLRGTLVDVFRKAIAVGWATMNPAEVTELPTAKVRRARLSLEQFGQVLRQAGDGWMPVAMQLALCTAQRREDIAAMRFDHVRDGRLWVTQQKTGNRVAIPLTVCAHWLPLGDIITKARLSGAVSRYIVHHTAACGFAKVGDPVHPDTISRGFATARDRAGLAWGDKSPATFHEIRSLATRFYRERYGKDFAQQLAGHKDGSTTDLYTDARGEWVMVKAIG